MTDRARSRTEPPSGLPSHVRSLSMAGLLLLSAGSAVLLGIVTAEVLYPADYNAHRNTVSDLGAMRPENIVRQPSAAIFNTTMIVAGALIAVAAVLLYRSRVGLLACLPVAGLGVGMIGVGFFPGNTVMAVHQLVSVLTFLSGGVAALTTARLSPRALRPVHRLLGGVALAFLVGYTFLGGLPLFDRLGEGGVERWIVYPVVLWTVVLGAGLASGPGAGAPATRHTPRRHRSPDPGPSSSDRGSLAAATLESAPSAGGRRVHGRLRDAGAHR